MYQVYQNVNVSHIQRTLYMHTQLYMYVYHLWLRINETIHVHTATLLMQESSTVNSGY